MRLLNEKANRDFMFSGGVAIVALIYLAAPQYAFLVGEMLIFLLFAMWVKRAEVADSRLLMANKIFMGVMIASVLFSATPFVSAHIAANFFSYFLAFYSVLLFVTFRHYHIFLTVLAVTVLTIDGYALAQYYSGQVVSWDGTSYVLTRLIGTMDHPIIFSGYLLNFICLFMVQGICPSGLRKRQRVLYSLAAAVSAVLLIMSGTRGGWLAFLGMMVFWLLLDLRCHRRRAAAILIVIILFVGGINYTPSDNRLTVLMNKPEVGDAGRMDMWLAAGKMFLDHPIYGIGLYQYSKFYTEQYRNPTVEYQNWQNAHNDYLNFLAETGLQGAAAYILLLGTIFSVYYRKYILNRDNTGALTIVLMIVFLALESLTYCYFTIPNNMRIYFMIIGLCAVAERQFRLTNLHNEAKR